MFKNYYREHRDNLANNRTANGIYSKGLHPVCIDIISMVYSVTLIMMGLVTATPSANPLSSIFGALGPFKWVIIAIFCALGVFFMQGFPNMVVDCYIVYQIHKGNIKMKIPKK